MPGPTTPISWEIISPDGKSVVKVTYPPGSTKSERRAIRKEARKKFFFLYGGDDNYRSKKGRRKGHRRISVSYSRHRHSESQGRNPNPTTTAPYRLGTRIDYQNGKVFQRLPVTDGQTKKVSYFGMECWDQVNPGPPFHTVGPFALIKYEVPGSEVKGGSTSRGFIQNGLPGDYSVYTGNYLCGPTWIDDSFGSYATASLANFPSLSAYHDRAWDQLKPQVSAWNGSQFGYELKDLPGMLKTTAEAFGFRWKTLLSENHLPQSKWWETPQMGPHYVADQFLNGEFGWAPFIGDLRRLCDAWENSATFISNMVKNNRHWIKRRRVLDAEDVILGTQRYYMADVVPSDGALDWRNVPMCKTYTLDGVSCRGHTDFTVRKKQTTWAVGDFMYYRPEFDPGDPDFDSGIMTLRRMLTQYGLRINPSVVYKVAPWTWLVDWFTNLGKHIDRLNDYVEDQIVSRELCVCRTEERTVTKTCFLNYYVNPITLHFQKRLTLKKRELADSPYGFNSPWNTLSPERYAILGSLGISRLGSGFLSRGR